MKKALLFVLFCLVTFNKVFSKKTKCSEITNPERCDGAYLLYNISNPSKYFCKWEQTGLLSGYCVDVSTDPCSDSDYSKENCVWTVDKLYKHKLDILTCEDLSVGYCAGSYPKLDTPQGCITLRYGGSGSEGYYVCVGASIECNLMKNSSTCTQFQPYTKNCYWNDSVCIDKHSITCSDANETLCVSLGSSCNYANSYDLCMNFEEVTRCSEVYPTNCARFHELFDFKPDYGCKVVDNYCTNQNSSDCIFPYCISTYNGYTIRECADITNEEICNNIGKSVSGSGLNLKNYRSYFPFFNDSEALYGCRWRNKKCDPVDSFDCSLYTYNECVRLIDLAKEYCFWNSNEKTGESCQLKESIKKCEDVNTTDECNKYSFNNIDCVTDPDSQKCTSLDKIQCSSFQTSQKCNDFFFSYGRCAWNSENVSVEGKCVEISTIKKCSDVAQHDICIYVNSMLNLSCSWGVRPDNNGEGICYEGNYKCNDVSVENCPQFGNYGCFVNNNSCANFRNLSACSDILNNSICVLFDGGDTCFWSNNKCNMLCSKKNNISDCESREGCVWVSDQGRGKCLDKEEFTSCKDFDSSPTACTLSKEYFEVPSSSGRYCRYSMSSCVEYRDSCTQFLDVDSCEVRGACFWNGNNETNSAREDYCRSQSWAVVCDAFLNRSVCNSYGDFDIYYLEKCTFVDDKCVPLHCQILSSETKCNNEESLDCLWLDSSDNPNKGQCFDISQKTITWRNVANSSQCEEDFIENYHNTYPYFPPSDYEYVWNRETDTVTLYDATDDSTYSNSYACIPYVNLYTCNQVKSSSVCEKKNECKWESSVCISKSSTRKINDNNNGGFIHKNPSLPVLFFLVFVFLML